jgi:hypothetical protein
MEENPDHPKNRQSRLEDGKPKRNMNESPDEDDDNKEY